MAAIPSIAERLLAWYAVNARVLPWRAPPGANAADPYRVWLSEVMLQQTTVAAVRPRYAAWVARWPDIASLAAADEGEVMAAWAGLGYYARARNLIATARAIVEDHDGRFPEDEADLRALPGLGDYTAAAVSAIAFSRRAVIVDANVVRVVARLFAVAAPLPGARGELRRHVDAITPAVRAGDFAQAMMDLGATICTPRAPDCPRCPLAGACAARAEGQPDRYPVKPAKRARPQRFGTIFWLERDGRVWLVRRPARGLLGGMRALPTGPWTDAVPGLEGAPADAAWRVIDARVSHVFTHFRLECALAVAHGDGQHRGTGEWWPIDSLDAAGLPTVFAKAAVEFRRGRCG